MIILSYCFDEIEQVDRKRKEDTILGEGWTRGDKEREGILWPGEDEVKTTQTLLSWDEELIFLVGLHVH